MGASREFAAFLQERLEASLPGDVVLRRMFGSTGVFCDGIMIGLVDRDDGLFLRVDDGNRDVFAQSGFGDPFTYQKQGKATSLAYLAIPDGLLDEPEALASAVQEAFAAASRLATKRASSSRSARR